MVDGQKTLSRFGVGGERRGIPFRPQHQAVGSIAGAIAALGFAQFDFLAHVVAGIGGRGAGVFAEGEFDAAPRADHGAVQLGDLRDKLFVLFVERERDVTITVLR